MKQGDWANVHQLPALVIARATSPKSPKGRHRFVETLLLLYGVVIKVQALVLVPQVFVNHLLPEFSPLEPFLAGLHPADGILSVRVGIRLHGGRERRKWEGFFQLEFVFEDFPDGSADVHLVLVQEGLEIDSPKVCATFLESIGGVMARLSDGSVVQEVLVEFGFAQNTIVIPLGEFVDGNPVLRCVGLENVGEVGRFRLGGNTQTVRPESGETGLGIHSRLGDPDGMVFFDGSLNGSLEPLTVGIQIRAVKLVVNLESHVGEERRLGPTQVV